MKFCRRNFHPIHARCRAPRIDQPFEQKGRLRPAGAAIGVDRHGVGEHRLHLDIDRRRLVHAGQQRGVQIGRHRRREGGEIRAHVAERVHAQREEIALASSASSAVLTWSRPCASDMNASVRSAVHFTGRLQLAGGPGDDRLLGIVIDLAAEAAADIRRDHAQLVLGDLQHESAHQQPDHVRVLAGGVQRVVAGRRIEIAERRARLHRVRDQPVVGQVQLHDFGGLANAASTAALSPRCQS